MTPIQKRTDDLNWMSLEGKTLDDSYILGQCLGADEHKVVFKAQKTGDTTAAVIKICRAISETSDEQIGLWEGAQQLRHPNLLTILKAGRTQIGGQNLIYVAVEPADEILDRILRERPLDTTEAGELVTSMCRGLARLHEAGFVHGSLSPENVLGVGDAIKLSTDVVRKAGSAVNIGLEEAKYHAPESANGNTTAEADVWCLGATLYEAMTQKECGDDCRSEAPNLPAPFGTIVHRSLDSNPETRCTVSDVLQLCERRQHAFAAAAGASADVIAAGPQNTRLEGGRRADDESRYFVPRSTPAAALETRRFVPHSVRGGRAQWRTWILLSVALVVVAILIWLARPRTSGASATAPRPNKSAPRSSSAAPAQRTTPQRSVPAAATTAPARVSTPTHSQPANNKPRRAEHTTRATPEQTHLVNGPIWRVVTYTYDSPADAENRASLINKRHPDLKAGVFAPNGNAGPYLVVIGGQMSRDSAVTLRQKALRLGLPRDSYLQNYKQ